LIDKYLADEATPEEIDLLSRYYNSFQDNRIWNEAVLGDPVETEEKIFAGIVKNMGAVGRDETYEPIERHIEPAVSVADKHNRKIFTFLRVATAASFIGIIAWGSVVWFNSMSRKDLAEIKPPARSDSNEVVANRAKATLRVADGSTISLDSARNGEIVAQGNTKITKTGRKLFYNPLPGTNATVYNTVSTGRGGVFQVDLPDGSQVWLNAASSIRFPVAFVEKQRRVEITGEAYFEVAKNKRLPFIVEVNGAEVQVLGTHFNVMAYDDESSVKTTLLEGAVKFVKGVASSTLLPGQQSQLLQNGKIRVKREVELDREIAWKNDQFDFRGEDIETVTRQLARWYAVDFVYEQKIHDHFIARLPRSTTLQKMLRLLELTGKVHFVIEASRVIVKR
jgi:transmembrane sensor